MSNSITPAVLTNWTAARVAILAAVNPVARSRDASGPLKAIAPTGDASRLGVLIAEG